MADDSRFGAFYGNQPVSEDLNRLQWQKGPAGELAAGVRDDGVLASTARDADSQTAAIRAMADAATKSLDKTDIGQSFLSPQVEGIATLLSLGPDMLGSIARLANGVKTLATEGRLSKGVQEDPRAADAALLLPAAGSAGRAVAPALRMSPEAASVAATTLGAYGVGHGVASEARASGDGNRVTVPVERSRQQFETTYEVPRPALPSIDDHARSARQRYEQSPAYQSLVQQKHAMRAGKEADRIEREARDAYPQLQQTFQQQLKDWESGRETAWGTEQADHQRRLKAFQDQGFWDRHPEIASHAMGAAYAVPALLGASTAVRKGAEGRRLLDAVNGAGDDVGKAALAETQAAQFLNPSVSDRLKGAAATTLAAGAPFEVRSIGDAIDATFAPEGSGAKERAKAHFADPVQYLIDGMPQILSGAIMYGTGHKVGSLANPAPKAELKGALDSAGRAERARGIGDRTVAAQDAQARIDAIRREISDTPVPGAAPAPPTTPSPAGVASEAKPSGLEASVTRMAESTRAIRNAKEVARHESLLEQAFRANPNLNQAEALRYLQDAGAKVDKADMNRAWGNLIESNRIRLTPGKDKRERRAEWASDDKGAFAARGD